ncbi:MAG: hypothetical protein RL497_429 [Pseudomonadota bacterium]
MQSNNHTFKLTPSTGLWQRNHWKTAVSYVLIATALQATDILLATTLNNPYVLALSNVFIVYLIALKKISRTMLYGLIISQISTILAFNLNMSQITGLALTQGVNLIIFHFFLKRYPLLLPPNPDHHENNSSNYLPPAQPHEQDLLKNFTRICSAWLIASTLSCFIFGMITSISLKHFIVHMSAYWLANICTFIACAMPIMAHATVPFRVLKPRLHIKEYLTLIAITITFFGYSVLIINTSPYPFIYALLPMCLLAVRLPVGSITFILYASFAGNIALGMSDVTQHFFHLHEITVDMIHTACITAFIPLFFAFMVKAFENRQRHIAKLSERMSLANKAVGLGVWEWSISTRNVWWDHAMYDLYGLTPQAMTYARWRQCIHPDDVCQLERLLKNMARAKNEFTTCFRIIHPDLGIRHIQAAATIVYNDDTHPLRYVGMNWDVTNLKSAELALYLAKQKAEAASHIKSEFVANMSHEIRTPLNAALGAAQLLQNTELSVSQKKYTNMIKQSGESLLAIVNDILDFSKIESGHAKLSLGIFNLKDVAQKVVNILSPQAGAKGLEFILHIDKNVPTFVEGDALKLHQVLTNLTSNAIRFTHGGEVTIEITAQKPQQDKTRISFAVIDTGIGIAKNKQLNLFDAFTQVDSSSTRQYGGTGLGLAIAKRLVKLMGGDLQLESDEGLGSRFHFSLEITQIAQRNFTNPLENQPLRVLIIDNNIRVIDSVKHLVARWPWDLIAATSTDQALNIFPTANNLKPIDLLIVESRTLVHEGQLLIPQLIKLGLSPNCLRLVSDIYHEPVDITTRAIDQVDSYLIKPFTQTGLLEAIQDGRNHRDGINRPVQQEMNLPTQLLNGINILLVEDNPLNQVVAKGLLEQFGARIDQAWNGCEALELISKNTLTYHIILLDIQMPVMDGYSTCHALNERGNKIPIIAMSAGVLSSEREHCERIGIQGFVPKPIEIQTLLNEIQKIIPNNIQTNTQISTTFTPIENTLFYPERLLQHITQQAQSDGVVKGIEQLIANSETLQNKLINKIETADFNAAAKILHSQKGAWGNLGAAPLYRQLCSLEVLANEHRLNLHCRQWQAYSQLFIQTRKEAEDWLAQHQLTQPTETSTELNCDAITLESFLLQLSGQNLRACDSYTQLKNVLSRNMSEHDAAQLDNAMNNLDFAIAANIVRTHCCT